MIIKKKHIPFLEVPLVEHCNLNCDCCNSHANYVKNSIYEYEKFKEDVSIISEMVHYSIVTFLGGEPLLCDNINEYINYARQKKLADVYRVLTNGILLEQMDDDFFDVVDVIEVSHYPEDKKDIAEYNRFLELKARKHHFRYYVKNVGKFNRIDSIQLTDEEAQRGYISCSRIKNGNMIFNGYYYKCMRPKTTNLYLMTEHGIELKNDLRYTDGIRIDKNFMNILEEYLSNDIMLESCKYCLMGIETQNSSLIRIKQFGYQHPALIRIFYSSNIYYHLFKKMKKMILIDEAVATKKKTTYIETIEHNVSNKYLK